MATQNQDVLDHLQEHGEITSLEAIKLYGITRISAIIFNLREMGYLIRSNMTRVKTRRGYTHVARYQLMKKRRINE